MPDIVHDFPIKSPAKKIFQAISTPRGLDIWWTKESSGQAKEGAEYKLWFGPENDWRAAVSRCLPEKEFELEVVDAHEDWLYTRIGFLLIESNGVTQVRFHHTGSPVANEHYRVSCYCWAMYLRLLKRYVEFGEIAQYEKRLDV